MVWRLFVVIVMLVVPYSTIAEPTKLNSAGLHIQDWFHNSDLNLSSDLKTAAAEGKDLMLLVEQRGCAYCAKLHAKNFTRAEILDLLDESFLVVQLDLNGQRIATDFGGTQMSEANLMQKWGVAFTPTTLVFSRERANAPSAKIAEAFRLPGYLEPLQYYLALDYFASGQFKVVDFKEFMPARISEMTEAGFDPQSW